MVKVTILSEEKDDSCHSVLAFYKFVHDQFVFTKVYNLEKKEFHTHTELYSLKELKNLKKALEAI